MNCEECKCGENYNRKFFTNHLKSTKHKNYLIKKCDQLHEFKLLDFAFKNRVSAFILENKLNITTANEFLKSTKSSILELIKKLIIDHTALKISFEIFCLVEIPQKN